MPSQQNIDQLQVISDKVTQSKNIILADYSGISVSDQTNLRSQIKPVGGELTVAKNNLIRIALKKRSQDLPEVADSALNGPTAIMYGFEDPVSATKVLVEFAKSHETIHLKAGLLIGEDASTDQYLDEDAIKNLAKLPGKDELRAKLVATLQAPISGFVNVLSGNLRGLVQVLNAIKDQKSAQPN
jgi:large subunit ribosomal protein L10